MQPTYFLSSIAFLAITAIGLSGFYERAPTQAIGITILLLTLLALAAYRLIPRLNAQVKAIRTENLILLHTIRAPIGASFIGLHSLGMLPEPFAIRAGVGDITVALLGVITVLIASRIKAEPIRNRLYLVWSILGLIDLFLAVGTGLHEGLADQASMIWITRLPLLLVPAFLLPVLFSTHIIILKRICFK